MSELVAKQTEGLTAGGFLGNATFTPASEILPGLWMGGCPEPSQRLPDDFGFVLSLYPWGRWEIGPDTNRLEVRLYDGTELPDLKLLTALALVVNEQRQEEKKVLVHCQAGLNRSGLVTGVALVLDSMTGIGAIALLRARRDAHVLCNPVFESYVRSLG